uniref:Porin domain-containing protein n=1 Tax=Candidatus Riesia pthiripubis TaxID=428412 RepID=A0A1V0HP55_9ENTR
MLINIAVSSEIYNNKSGSIINLCGNINTCLNAKTGGSNSKITIGINGKTKINKNITGLSYLEFSSKTNGNENLYNLAHIGIKVPKIGIINYGKNYILLHNINSWVNLSVSRKYEKNYVDEISKNLLTYTNDSFFNLIDGLNFSLQYVGKSQTKTKDDIFKNHEGFGIYADYNIGHGLIIGGAYSELDKSYKEHESKNFRSWNGGAKYEAKNLYFAAMYGESKNRFLKTNDDYIKQLNKEINGIKDFGFMIQYFFDNLHLKPSVSYMKKKEKSQYQHNNKNKEKDLEKFILINTMYFFNKDLTAVLDYKLNLLNDNNIGLDRNSINFGIGYRF